MKIHKKPTVIITVCGVSLAAGLILLLLITGGQGPLHFRFENYRTDRLGTPLAILSLSNRTRHTFQIPLTSSQQEPELEGVFSAWYAFTDKVEGTWTNWSESFESQGGYSALHIAPQSQVMLAVPLPEEISVRRAGVHYFQNPSNTTFLDKCINFTKNLFPSGFQTTKLYQTWCPTDLSREKALLLIDSDPNGTELNK